MRLWKRVKTQSATRADLHHTPQVYPSGICVKTEKGAYLIHKDGKRYRIPSQQILDSWSFPVVVDTSEAAVVNYPVAVSRLGFRDGSLLNNIADGKIYLVSESKLRHITSVSVLGRLGVTKDDFMLVSDSDINIMKRGEEIN